MRGDAVAAARQSSRRWQFFQSNHVSVNCGFGGDCIVQCGRYGRFRLVIKMNDVAPALELACGFRRAADKMRRCSFAPPKKKLLCRFALALACCWPADCFPRRPRRRIISRAPGRWSKGCRKTRSRRWCRRATAICGWAPTTGWRGSTAFASRFSTTTTRRNCAAAASRACLKPATARCGSARKAATFRNTRTAISPPCRCARIGAAEKFTPSPPTTRATSGC